MELKDQYLHNMSIQEKVQKTIRKMNPGCLVTYENFKQLGEKYPNALAKSLERLVESGDLVRQKRGVYYKPKKSRFGQLNINENEIIRNLMYENSRLIGYPSGAEAFRKLGISTQVPNSITISTIKPRRKMKINNLNINFTKSKINKIKKRDIIKLQILDTLKDIKKIQDSDINNAINKIYDWIDGLSIDEKKDMVRIAKKYTPQTRALLGAIIEVQDQYDLAEQLKKTLNPYTSFTLNISDNTLPNKKNWRIK